jgi:undecaprenyl-diphosphatase
MTLVQIIVLALIQGLTEFLPVSSSAHLILGSQLFGWPDQGLAFDVATHLGTLVAVCWYFRKDLALMVSANLQAHGSQSAHRRLGRLVLIASIPAIFIGFLAADWIEIMLRDIRIIAIATLVFGGLLWLADMTRAGRTALREISLPQAVWIGIAQVLALIPGTSRSGVTITAGLALGLDRHTAARFSFLLSIPVIAAAGGYGALKVFLGESPIGWFEFSLALGLSAVTALLCIWAFLRLLAVVGLLPFILYRLLLGAILFWIAFY